jgi:hypothetical protein
MVSVATVYMMDDPGVGSTSSNGVKNFLFSTSSRLVLWSTQSLIQWILGGWGVCGSIVVKALCYKLEGRRFDT